MIFAYLQEPPFCFTEASGTVRGCDVELAQAICESLGLGKLRPVEAEFAELLPGLVDRRWTMTTGLFVTDERKKVVDFTRPIWSLQDGLLVAKGNPRGFSGYRSVAADGTALIGAISDQVQHRTALQNGIPPERVRIFATQAEAAQAVAGGGVDAYASVAMAHRGYVAHHPEAALDIVEVPDGEKAPAFGAFALGRHDAALRGRIDASLDDLVGTPWHREMMARYGFSDAEIDRVIEPR